MPLSLQARMVFFALIPILSIGGWSAALAQQTQRTASDYGISSEGQVDLSDADTKVWLNRLNDIELTLRNEEISAEVERRALRDVNKISKGAKVRFEQEQARLKPIRRELDSLGPAPAEGEASESEEIANLRHEVIERTAEIEFGLREIQLVLVRADNLELALITRAEDPTFSRLWVHSPILLDADTWRIAGTGWLTLARAVAEAPGAWWDARSGISQPAKPLIAAFAGLIALLLGVPGRRWLQRRLGRRETEADPTYAWRIGAAFVTAVADVLLPSLALGTIALAIWLLSETGTLLPSLAISGCISGIIYFALTGLSRAVLAPQAPAWRILPITEEGAVVLNRRVRIVALYIAVLDVLYRTAAGLGLLQSPEFKTVSTLFLDAALVGLLLTLLPSRFWHAEEEEASRVVVGVSITLGALLVAIPVLDLVGFSVLASFLLWGLVITVVAAGFALLLRVAGHEALAQILRPASTLRLRLYRWLRLGEGAAKVLRILGNLLVDLTLFLTLAYGLLRFYGLPDALLFHWIERFAKGIPIGNVVLSPIDIFMAILVFAGTLLATGMLRRWLAEKLRTGTRLDLGMRNAIVSGVGYGGWVLAIVIAIATVGLDLSNLALVAGALSVGVGFGLRTVVENFVAGLLLLIERPIKEGDWIVTAGYQGTVKRISVRSTEIETFDRASVILPNAELIAQPVQNWTHKSRMARIIVPVGVAYGSDTAKVSDILQACAEEHPEVQRYPEPYIIFQQFGASSLDFELRCYVKDTDFVMTCKSDLNFAIDKAFREQGIEIPFPQRDVHLREKTPPEVTLTDRHPAAPASSPPSPAKAYAPSRKRRDAETNGGDAED